MKFGNSRQRWILSVLLLALALSLCLVFPAYAHGGEPGHATGPLADWLVGLTYLQLFMAPIIGVWLLRETVAAWRVTAGETDNA